MRTRMRWAVGGTLLITGCTALGPLPYVDFSSGNFTHNTNCKPPMQGGASATAVPNFCFESNNPEPQGKPGVLDLVDARLVDYTNQAATYSPQTVQLAYDGGITVLALGAVATAVFTHGAARANWLAGIGIGAGAATTVWGWANPSTASDAYRLGAYRAACLRAAAVAFDDSGAPPSVTPADDNLKTSITNIQNKASMLGGDSDKGTGSQAFIAAVKAKDGPTAASATQASDAAAAAQKAASDAVVAAKQEDTIYLQRGVLVYTALQKIDAQVYAAVKGTAITYQSALTSINQAIAATSASTPVVSGLPKTSKKVEPAPAAKAPTAASMTAAITAVTTSSQQLASDAAALSAYKPFSTAAKAVSDCTTTTVGN